MDIGHPPEGPCDLSYIERVKNAIKVWRAATPSVVARAFGIALEPVNWIIKLLVPQSAIEGALSGFDWVAKNTLTAPATNDIDDLKQCDRGADQVVNFHVGVAVAEGGAAGFFGAFTLPLDVPAMITLALRCIRQVGVEYGYSDDIEEERKFVFSVLSAVGANSQEEKAAALGVATLLMNKLAKETWKAMAAKAATNHFGADAAIIATKNLAKQLGINLTKRKALAAIPAIGAVVGASVNGWFIREVGVAAQRLYQERWLRDRGMIVDPEIS